MSNPLIIFGSARSNGDTFKAVNLVTNKLINHTFIDLANYTIEDFDYEYKNQHDDFNIIAEQMLMHDYIILATPVYWYSMSSSMKRFLDRITDLLSKHKEKGRQLRGKNLAIISAYGTHLGLDLFEKVFILTAEYLGMNYLGSYLYYSGEDTLISSMNIKNAEKFCKILQQPRHY